MTDSSSMHVLLAGGSGAIGSGLAQALAEDGARLSLPVRRAWQVDRTKAQLAELGSDRLLVGTTGAMDPEAIGGFVKGAEDALGPIDAFVSALGAFHFGELGKESNGRAEELFDANVLANHRILRALLPRFQRRRGGRIVFCGAAAERSDEPVPGMALYLASKGALDRYAVELAAETRDDRIDVALLSLGIIDTPANREAMPESDPSAWTSIEAVTASVRAALRRPATTGGGGDETNFVRLDV